MNKSMIILVIVEATIILGLLLLKLCFDKADKKKIDKILKYMDNHKKEDTLNKVSTYLDILKQNKNSKGDGNIVR